MESSKRHLTATMPPPGPAEVAARWERVEKICAEADAILRSPGVVEALRRVGQDGQLTAEEERVVLDETGLRSLQLVSNTRIAADYRVIIQALARRVANGTYTSPHSAEATQYVYSNTFVGSQSPDSPIYSLYRRVWDLRVPLELFAKIGKQILEGPEYAGYRAELERRYASEPDVSEGDRIDLYRPVRLEEVRLYHNHGCINVPTYQDWHVDTDPLTRSFQDKLGILAAARSRRLPIKELYE